MSKLAETRPEFDSQQVLDDVLVVCRYLKITEREAQKRMNIPLNTLAKLKSGIKPSTDHCTAIFAWLDPSQKRYLRVQPAHRPVPDTEQVA